MERALLGAVILCLTGGCASGGIRELTRIELDITDRMLARLEENGQALEGALDGLGDLSGEAIADQHSLSASVAKAGLLESMRSPWLPRDSTVNSARGEVVLYRLYGLAEAEEGLLEARLAERRATLQEVRDAYKALTILMAKVIEGERMLLAHMNAKTSARLNLMLDALLEETEALRGTLAQSDNPRLRLLAEEVRAAEERVEEARELLKASLEILHAGQGETP
jgi:hypothetical protein